MFTKLMKLNPGASLYEDIDGENHMDMDITDMQLGASGESTTTQSSGDPAQPKEPAEGMYWPALQY